MQPSTTETETGSSRGVVVTAAAILEALACGAPVVASERSSIPEVVGNAGLLCDPVDVEAIAGALRRVLDEPGLADDLRRRGFEQAAHFTWTRTAEGFAVVLDDVLA